MSEVSFTDFEVLSRTVFGEAAGEPWLGRVAVAHVVMNRFRSKKWFAGVSIAETCRKPMQFSCWNEGDPVHEKMLHTLGTSLAPCMAAVMDVLSGTEKDPTGGATHYYADSIKAPAWAQGKVPSAVIGHHKFFINVD